MDAELNKEIECLNDQVNSATTLKYLVLPFVEWFGPLFLMLPFLIVGGLAFSKGNWILGLMIISPVILMLGLVFFGLFRKSYGLRITTNHLIVGGIGKSAGNISAWPNIDEFVIVKRRRFFFFSKSLIGIKYKYDIGSVLQTDKRKCHPKNFDYLFPSNFGEMPENLLDMLNSYLEELA